MDVEVLLNLVVIVVVLVVLEELIMVRVLVGVLWKNFLVGVFFDIEVPDAVGISHERVMFLEVGAPAVKGESVKNHESSNTVYLGRALEARRWNF